MSLGDNYNNNKDKNKKSPTVYSNYKFSNVDGFDPSMLSPTFWNGMLKLTISPKKEGDEVKFDHDAGASIYLSHLKAKQLADEIEVFKANPEAYSNVGVATRLGLISISNGKEFTGSVNPCIVIREIDESGNVKSSFAYEFKKDYHYTIRNYNEKDNSFDKIYNNELDLNALQQLLLDYYAAMNGAVAYSVMEYGRFDNSRINTKLDSIAQKLGVEYTSGKGDFKKGGNSMFDKAQGRNYTMGDLDSIDNGMEE